MTNHRFFQRTTDRNEPRPIDYAMIAGLILALGWVAFWAGK